MLVSDLAKLQKYIGCNMKIKNAFPVLLTTLCLSQTAAAATVGSGSVSTAFSKDSTSISAFVGSGSAFNDNYVILGVGVGYYLAQGVELGIDAQYWMSGDPSITKITPKITYVFTQPKLIKPYVGAFYRQTFYGDYKGRSIDDQSSYGGRTGAYFSTNNGVYIGGGVVYEEYLDCKQLSDCSTTYPELIFTVSF